MHDGALRDAIVAGGARLAARGLLVAAEGNLSVRTGTRELLITPTGRRKDDLAAADLLEVPLEVPADGDEPASGPRPSSDVAIHRAIYRARPDVRAVVHAHVPAAMALTVAGERPEPELLPETALLLPRIPFVPFAAMGSEELAGRIASALSTGVPLPGAVVLERHGAVAVGSGSADPDGVGALALALDRIELVDVLCRVTRDAILLRAARRTLSLD
jgi:L-fuculose-phosphate aldolase